MNNLKTYNSVKINNCKLTCPKVKKKDNNWKGKDILDVKYWIMSILAKRRSGKTTLIYNIIKNFAHKHMIILFFVPTFYKDSVYESIRNYLDRKAIVYQGNTSIENEEKVDLIDVFMKENSGGDENEESQEEIVQQPQIPVCNFGDNTDSQSVENNKGIESTPVEPEYMIIFDDMSSQLRHPSIVKLCKNSRHFKCKIILSSQSIVDLSPSQHSQIDYCVLFKNFNFNSIEQVYKRLQPNLSFEEFYELYKNVTEGKTGKYNNFLVIDRNKEEYRKNMNEVIVMN